MTAPKERKRGMKLFFLLRGWFAARPKKRGEGGLFLRRGIDTTATLPNTAALPPLSACQGGREGVPGIACASAADPPFLSRDQGSRGRGGGREKEGK